MASINETIRQLAENKCEYCQMPDGIMRFGHVLDHVIASQHGGGSSPSNLALCCGDCNRHKGPNIAGFDAKTAALTPLFHPRKDVWRDHFRWDGAVLVGMTSIGRVTVAVLAINLPIRVAARALLMEEGLFNQTDY